MYEDYLAHYGVKGQKWGVRRYQKKDGTLTPAGKKHYSDDNESASKSKHRQKLEQKYMSEGLSKEDARRAADKRIRTEKYVAAAAGVTVAACAAYVAYRKYAVDKTISKDEGFQRIMKMKPGEQLHQGPMYVAYKNNDKTKYKGILGSQFQEDLKYSNPTGKKVMNFDIKPHQDLKVASPKRARDTFEKLYKENSEFRDAVNKSNAQMRGEFGPGKQRDLYTKVLKNANNNKGVRSSKYEAFNIGLVNKSNDGKKASDMFYDALRKQGVNAVVDINDKKYSGYRAKNPLIMFGGKYDYSGKVMSSDQLAKSYTAAWKDIHTEERVERGALYAAKLMPAAAITTYTAYQANKMSKQEQRDKHKNEHRKR